MNMEVKNMEASEAAAALGRIKTEKKAASSAANAVKARERLQDPDKQAAANLKRSKAQLERWANVREEKERARQASQQASDGQTPS